MPPSLGGCGPSIHHHASVKSHALGWAVSLDPGVHLCSAMTSLRPRMLHHPHAWGHQGHDLRRLDTDRHSACACMQTDDDLISWSSQEPRLWSLAHLEVKHRPRDVPQSEKASYHPTYGPKTRSAETGIADGWVRRALGLSA